VSCVVGLHACIDRDECTLTDCGVCDSHATCTNTFGSFTCRCDLGYIGDGLNCTLGKFIRLLTVMKLRPMQYVG